MRVHLLVLAIALSGLLACNKSSNSAAPSNAGSSSSSKPPDAVEQKLQEYAGKSAADCGRLNVQASSEQAKAASDCALQASQAKHPFYVGYDMPGMAVGVAGNADGKLFTVQSQGTGESANVTAGDCPSQLRVASSGRVTCFAPGDMGSMSGSHAGGGVAPGMPNPHGGGMENPHGAAPKTK
ncbi:MAG: hypothetical protein WAM79_06995 [Candidatus Sulfotelmatobacter sp.]